MQFPGKVQAGALTTRRPYPAGNCLSLHPLLSIQRSASARCKGSSSRVAPAAVSSSNSSHGVNLQHFSLSTSFASPSKQVVPAHADAAAAEPCASVSFWLKLQTNWGEGVKLIGSHPKLGSWSLDKAIELRWAEGNLWTATVQLPVGAVYEYKYVVIDFGTKRPVSWQHGGNAVLAVDMSEAKLDVHDNWGNDPGAEVRADGLAITRENKLQKWAGTLVSQYKSAVQESQQLVQWAKEGQAIKGELARVKMELSLMQQAQRQSDIQVAELKEQNMCLQQDLIHARQELNASFTEALKLLTEDTWDIPEPPSGTADASSNDAEAASTDAEPSDSAAEAEDQSYRKWSSMNNNDTGSANGRTHASMDISQPSTPQEAPSPAVSRS